jgi:DNA-binding transcriptional ArsR family regulator
MLESEFQANRLDEAAGMFKAMAHPIRVSIMYCLKEGEKLTVTQIHERLNLEQSTTSHHLGILKDKGVLCSQRDGKNTYYYLKHGILGQIIDCIQSCTCDENA